MGETDRTFIFMIAIVKNQLKQDQVVMDQMQVVIIGDAERKLENLQTMLESVDRSGSVVAFNSCDDALKKLGFDHQAVLFIDYRNPEKQMDRAISELIMHKAVNYIVLLQARHANKAHFTHYTTSEVVFDDLTLGMLSSLLRNIELNSTV